MDTSAQNQLWSKMDPEIIVLSDSEEEDCSVTFNDSSVLIVEQNSKNAEGTPSRRRSGEVLDEDLAIMFSKRALVLPHARYDCCAHPFCPSESDVCGPLGKNEEFCDQCFCYVCDKLAAECKLWSVAGVYHCNAHKRSVYWKSHRDKSIMGYLHTLNFTFDLLEIDADLRRAESVLLQFSCSLAVEYSAFLRGTRADVGCCRCPCHTHTHADAATHTHADAATHTHADAATHTHANAVDGCKGCQAMHLNMLIYNYSSVYACVWAFLDQAVKENAKTSAVMHLGAAKLFMTHTSPSGGEDGDDKVCVSKAVSILLFRVMTTLQLLLVSEDLPPSFTKTLQMFFQSLSLPYNCRWLSNSLSVLPWDDPLLSAVLRGQNVSGQLKVKGRRLEVLFEPSHVVEARVRKLQQQNKYRELARYLKVVRCDNNTRLQAMRDLVPLYLCKVGDYVGAIASMLSQLGSFPCPASRLTPPQFSVYLRILTSGHTPSSTSSAPDHFPTQPDPFQTSQWEPVKGFDLLKKLEVVKFCLRVLNCNSTVFNDSETWVNLLNVVSSSPIGQDGSVTIVSYPEPDLDFQTTTRDVATSILIDLKNTSRIHIPRTFQNGFPDQAVLLLVTQALALRILQSRLGSALSVLRAFRLNPWAVRWLFSSLLCRLDVLQVLLCSILEELTEERHQPHTRRKDAAEHSFIADFLSLFFLEPSCILNPNIYPTFELLYHWNEADCPWQLHLRRILDLNEAKLSGDKHMILHLIRRNTGH